MANDLPTMYMDPDIGVGHVADSSTVNVLAAPAAGTIKYGAAVSYSADGTGSVQDVAVGTTVVGIARAFEGKMNAYADADDPHVGEYQATETVSVLTQGTVMVSVAGDVKAGDKAVYQGDGKFAASTAATDVIVGTFRAAGTTVAPLHVNF
ncbi:MAG: structural cement protein Gp24 [Weissella confusa]